MVEVFEGPALALCQPDDGVVPRPVLVAQWVRVRRSDGPPPRLGSALQMAPYHSLRTGGATGEALPAAFTTVRPVMGRNSSRYSTPMSHKPLYKMRNCAIRVQWSFFLRRKCTATRVAGSGRDPGCYAAGRTALFSVTPGLADNGAAPPDAGRREPFSGFGRATWQWQQSRRTMGTVSSLTLSRGAGRGRLTPPLARTD